tara:strand:+ start:305 stop:631 length:327 start_codon:yes stop_codon:yes gene_type:complete
MANPLWANNVAAASGAATARVSGTGDQAIAENGNRTSITFQNVGTVDIYYREDSTAPTAANAHYILSAPTTDQGGDGGFLKVDGVVKAMKIGAAGASYKAQIMEYVQQ